MRYPRTRIPMIIKTIDMVIFLISESAPLNPMVLCIIPKNIMKLFIMWKTSIVFGFFFSRILTINTMWTQRAKQAMAMFKNRTGSLSGCWKMAFAWKIQMYILIRTMYDNGEMTCKLQNFDKIRPTRSMTYTTTWT